MILITGASGKTGKALVQALAQRGAAVRAFVRRAEQQDHLLAEGAQEAISGDIRNAEDLTSACAGVQAIYHICPNMQPDEVAIAQVVLRAAQANHVEHFVYHSVLHPQTEEMPHHWQKLRVEELLFKSGLDFTILQPAAYMQNVLAGWRSIVEEGRYRIPYAASTRLSMVDLADVAEAAALVLTEPGHSGTIYELSGVDVLTQTQVARVLAKVLARPVQIESIDRALWAAEARKAGLSPYAVATLRSMFEYYEGYGFAGNPRVLTMLLKRPPTDFTSFVQRVARSYQ